MSSTKRDHYADQKIDVDEVIKSNTNLVKKIAWHIYGRASHAIEIEDLMQIGFAALVNSNFSSGGTTISCSSVASDTIVEGEPLFIRDGYDFTTIGTVSSTDTSANTITLAAADATIAAGMNIRLADAGSNTCQATPKGSDLVVASVSGAVWPVAQ